MSRFQKIRDQLDAYGLDAMMVTSMPNRLYVTQFRSSAGVALVTKEKNYFITDSRYIEAAGKHVTSAEIRLNTPQTSVTVLTNEILRAHGVKKLGFEEQYATVEEYGRWKEKLSCEELVPATKLITDLRAVKDQDEINCMVSAQRIAEKALEDVFHFIKPGVTEKEISAYLQYRMLCHGAEKMSFEPIVVSGVNSSMPHGVPSDKKVEVGDFVTMDFGCVYGGYCSDMTRTVAVGYATEEMEKVYYTVLEAQKAGIAAARAGVTGKAVHEAAAKVIEDAGYGEYFGHGFGHSLGVEIHENPRASVANDKPLPAGAVISAEPGIYLPGKFGVRIEDVIIIREDGCTDIMEAPHELIVLK